MNPVMRLTNEMDIERSNNVNENPAVFAICVAEQKEKPFDVGNHSSDTSR